MRIVQTENSTYQIDDDNKLIRRLAGVNDPTPYQGVDGEWQSFVKIEESAWGEGLFIWWDETRRTWTSPIVAER